MNANENKASHADSQHELIELGVASIETKGGLGDIETVGREMTGISDT